MVTHLCEKNEIDRTNIKLHLLKSEQVNAMALPNGHLVVFTGLVEFCDNESELFGVLGHEIAHIRHQHVMKKLIRELGLTFLFGAAGGDVNSILKVVTSTAYDRELEREADQSSVDYMAAAGIDPKPFAELIYRLRFMDSLKELIWISSHPGSEERAKNIASYSDEKKIAKQRFFKEEEWEELKKNMRGN
jgi:predicted Zn-dependent protease